jgi:3-hydroxybutyryl-CoA dehydratase
MMQATRMQIEKGIPYENLNIGDEASFSKTISESDIYQFSGISGDFNPVHVNEEYAKMTRFKSRIAHGPLTLSLIAPVLGTRLPGVGTVALEIYCRFKAPVYIGDTITASAMVSEKLEEKKWVRMTVVWTNHKNEIVAEGNALVMPPEGQE